MAIGAPVGGVAIVGASGISSVERSWSMGSPMREKS